MTLQSPAPSPGGIGDDEDDTDEEVNEQYLARMARATRRLAVRCHCLWYALSCIVCFGQAQAAGLQLSAASDALLATCNSAISDHGFFRAWLLLLLLVLGPGCCCCCSPGLGCSALISTRLQSLSRA